MKKRIWALVCAGALMFAMNACSDGSGDAASADASSSASASESASAEESADVTNTASAEASQPSPSAEGTASAAASDAAGAAQADDTAEANELTTDKSIQNVSYRIGSGWVPIESGDTGVYGFNVGADAACSVTVAAMAADTLEGGGMDETAVAQTMTAALNISDPVITDADFKGIAGASFTGTGPEGEGAEGYVVKQGDYYYVIMLLSTDTESPDVQAVWKNFQDTVAFG